MTVDFENYITETEVSQEESDYEPPVKVEKRTKQKKKLFQKKWQLLLIALK